ncbi:hypothetical protein AX15_007520 [Amanita polypyramis BW_CC]|nr:hypothetical protein AX15_007520 [Amanita polypyramis BW_CC]
MSSNTNKKAVSKYKPHPILGRYPIKPILDLFSLTKKSNKPQPDEPLPVEQDSSITLPCSYPHGSNVKRTKNRTAGLTPRYATSDPGPVARRSNPSKSKSFDRLNKEVEKAMETINGLSNEDRIFVEQMGNLTWMHDFRTELIEGRDKAERASSKAEEQKRQRAAMLALLREQEMVIKELMRKQVSKQMLRDVTRKLEVRQMKAAIEKAIKEVEEQVKQGEIRKERTIELIRVVNKSELDILVNSDPESVRVELQKLAQGRKKLAEEQAAMRQQFEEIAKARAEIEETKKRLRAEEEATRTQTVQTTARFNEMLQEYYRLQQEICQLQSDKEAALRQSDDILLQAYQETRRIEQAHDIAVRETQDMAERNVTEAMSMFQARLEQETIARMRAEQQAIAVTAAADAMAAAAAGAEAPQPMDLRPDPLDVPQPIDIQTWGLQLPPPPHSSNLQPPPLPVVMTDTDRVTVYERKWAALRDGINEAIFFQQIPWPVLIDLSHPDQLNITEVYRFIANEAYLGIPGQQHKSIHERIRTEMLRWHPDRFNSRVLPKVELAHRQVVQETAERVAKMLTQIMGEAPI